VNPALFGRLEARLVALVGLGLLVFSLIAGFLTYATAYRVELERAQSLQQQLVRTVQAQAEVAAFAANDQIAQDVLSGLMASPVILAVRIESTSGGFAADLGDREKARLGTATTYALRSPVDQAEPIGRLLVVQNDELVQSRAATDALYQTLLLLLQVLLAVLAMVAVLRVSMIRPIAQLAQAMAAIQPGSAARLAVDTRHAGDEIGQLAAGANALLDAAARAIEQERGAHLLLEATGRIARIGGWTYDPESRTLTWTRELYRIFDRDPARGITLDEAMAYFPSRAQKEIATAMAFATEQGMPYDLELPMRTEGDQDLWLRLQGQPQARPGHPPMLLGAAQDITERKRAENALVASEQKFSRAFYLNPDAMTISRVSDGVFVAVNRGFAQMLGCGEDEILGHSSRELAIWETPEDRKRLFDRLEQDGQVTDFETRFRRRDGMSRIGLISACLIDINKVPHMLAINRDITDRKQDEAELLAAKQAAENANLTKSRFLAAASHDLRQPVQALNLFSAALLRTKLTGEQKLIGNYLAQSIHALGEILNALLDVSKLDAGFVVPCDETIQVESLFDRIDAEFSHLAAEHSLRFKLYFPFREMAIRTDGKLLMSLLGNIIGNAIKYTHQGGVLVGARRRGGEVLIQVWDTGIGIAPEYQEKIFDEYFQIENSERDRAKGLGLGLAIVKRLARLLNTKVVCRSRPGRGSLFEFRLPLADEPPAAAASPDELTTTTVDASSSLAGLHVAVVEDDTMIAKGIELSLASFGATVASYGNAEDALADPAIAKADFYISDFHLPGLSGTQLFDAIEQRTEKPIKAAIITGDTSPNRIEVTQSSRWPVLFKPIDLPRLVSLIESQQA
jgi:PAS domain S-box-containing protein